MDVPRPDAEAPSIREVVRGAALKIARAREQLLEASNSEVRVLTEEEEWAEDRRESERENQDATWRILREEIAAEGYDLDDAAVQSEMRDALADLEPIIETAMDVEDERLLRVAARKVLREGAEHPVHPGVSPVHPAVESSLRAARRHRDPRQLAAWAQVYRPQRIRRTIHSLPHGARHRRAPGRRPLRRAGSRRTTAPTRAGPDEGDPEPVGTRPRSCWQTAGAW